MVARKTKSERGLELLQGRLPYHFRLSWSGDKFPTGATLGGEAMVAAQNGMIVGESGEVLGYYEREVDCGGDSGNEQRIMIATEHVDITPPPGGAVEVCAVNAERGR